MNINFKKDYSKLTDREMIDLVLAGDEDAMLYLIFVKYEPLMIRLCLRYYDDLRHLEELQVELFAHLKANDWRYVRNFEWRSTFGWWLGLVAGTVFLNKVPELIGISKLALSISENGSKGEVCLPYPEHPHENDVRMVILIEAICHLDKDLQFVLFREFDGYKPVEIAKQLEDCRREEDRLKTKVVDGKTEEIIPTKEYIHMLKGRAKDQLKPLVKELKREFKW